MDIIILKIHNRGRWGNNIENNKHKNSTTIMSITFLIIKYSLATNELLKYQMFFLSFKNFDLIKQLYIGNTINILLNDQMYDWSF